jgi:5-methylcytosine-specific restriction endonuclease McrA
VTKKCAKCNLELPLSEFRRCKRRKDGLDTHCKSCMKAWEEGYRSKNQEQIKAKQRKHYQENHERYRENRQRWYKENDYTGSEFRNARLRKTRESPANRLSKKRYYLQNKEAIAEYWRKRYVENKPAIKLRQSSYYKRYYPKNRNHITAVRSNYKARVLGREGTLTAQDIENQYKIQNGKCFYCLRKLGELEFVIDHKIPFARGGLNEPANIVCACASCNSRKNVKTPEEFKP